MENEELCVCAFCGTEISWGGDDPQNGSVWICEHCGTYFCQKCFADKHGLEAFYRNVKESERILCPDCYVKDSSESLKS